MSRSTTTLRAVLGAVCISALVLLVGCGRIAPSGFSGDVDALLARGESFATALVNRSPERLSDPEIVALGYLERARLGLGSPFRLIEFALSDPDLPEDIRTDLAYGLLARALDGRIYSVDPGIMDMVWLAGVPASRPAGKEQLELINRAIVGAPTARAGERTVRLAYLLAESERTVQPGQEVMIAHVVSLLADRRRATEDADLLLRTAAVRQVDPLVLLRQWRRELRFQVEQPSLAAVSVREEEAEARESPELALALRTLAQRQSAPVSLVTPKMPATPPGGRSLLGQVAAERLRALAATRNYPAQAPVTVAVAINRDGLLGRRPLGPAELDARQIFIDEAINEERLAAGAAALAASGADAGPRLPLIMIQAATFLRVWNQEDPWFPGDVAPRARDLEARFGLAAIRFDDDVDATWRPYYLRMLGRSLTDLQRVAPTLSVRGLQIHIGELPSHFSALALHEPRSRTLYLPPRSGAGTIAHEIAHDLDWQLARRRYGTRGGYATDMAVRDHRGDRIAAAMMELSTALTQPTTEVALRPHATRPAEVFARGTDWLVAAVLASDGRLGGYLTSFQDPILTGYGTTRGPDITGAAVPALLSILDAVAPVSAGTREWALETYGPSRSLTPMELARAVTTAGLGLAADQRLQAIGQAGRRSFEAVSGCRFASTEGLRRLVVAQRSLAEASLSAAARGAAIDGVRALAVERGEESLEPAADAWLARRLYGAPEPIDPSIEELVPAFEDLLLHARLVERGPAATTAATAFHVSPGTSLCGGNPFAADTPVGRFRGTVGTPGR
ncbi:MAG: hypothetical protein WD737_01015 [Gemmatimonadota bacterium]